MPQLDVTAWPPQLIWLAIAFFLLYVIMAKVALPRVGGVIEARRGRIAQDLESAQRLKVETEKAAAAYEAMLAEARARGHEAAQKMREKAQAEGEQQRAKVDVEVEAQLAQADKRIGDMKARALSDIKAVAGELASDIVSQLVGTKITGAQAIKFLDGGSNE